VTTPPINERETPAHSYHYRMWCTVLNLQVRLIVRAQISRLHSVEPITRIKSENCLSIGTGKGDLDHSVEQMR
jgi:hypothetical protein